MRTTERLTLERREELSAVHARLKGVRAGSSAVIAVSGAAGVGKTLLLEQACRMAAESGLRLLKGRGVPLEHEFPFGVVRQLFESELVRAPPEQRAEWLEGAAADALGALGGVTDRVELGDFAVLHGLYWLTANIAQNGPVALVIDDLHWADVASLRFITYLLPRLEELPIAVIMASRPQVPGTPGLMDLVPLYPGSLILEPAGLTAQGTTLLLEALFGSAPERGFSEACHRATGGNPLLLRELVRALSAEKVTPVDGNATRVSHLGPRAVSRRVAQELERLSPDRRRLAEAMAVLAPKAPVHHAARLAGVSPEEAASGAHALIAIEVLRMPAEDGASAVECEFIHPLVQQAAYEQIPPHRRIAYHAEAVRLLTETGAGPEQIAAHLLRLPPGTAPHAVSVLSAAAQRALSRGSHETALTCLRRALAEPLDQERRFAVLTDAALAAARSDLREAIGHLHQALSMTTHPQQRAGLAEPLSLALLYTERADDAVRVLTETIADLAEDDDARRKLQAALLFVAMVDVGWDAVSRQLPAMRRLPEAHSVGALMLESMIASHETYACDRRAVDRARRVLAHPEIVVATSRGASSAAGAYFALVVGDLDEGIAAYTELIEEAHRHGSLTALYNAFGLRSFGWLRRGDLSEAEADLREAMRIGRLSHTSVADSMFWGLLGEVFTEQGRLDEAWAALDSAGIPERVPSGGIYCWFLQSRARLLYAQDRYEKGLDSALRAGERYAAHGGLNPAALAWRSTAAECLHALGRSEEALGFVAEEVDLARRWGAAHALGRALRVQGLVLSSGSGTSMLREAVTVLRPSSARLEYARALVDLGAARRRANARSEARSLLAEGLEVAARRGARPLVDLAQAEMRAAGAHPRSTAPLGVQELTPSEQRVAELAVCGLSNRVIAQRLYVTVKTVEVHLGSVYRKLGIPGRGQLAGRVRCTGWNGSAGQVETRGP